MKTSTEDLIAAARLLDSLGVPADAGPEVIQKVIDAFDAARRRGPHYNQPIWHDRDEEL